MLWIFTDFRTDSIDSSSWRWPYRIYCVCFDVCGNGGWRCNGLDTHVIVNTRAKNQKPNCKRIEINPWSRKLFCADVRKFGHSRLWACLLGQTTWNCIRILSVVLLSSLSPSLLRVAFFLDRIGHIEVCCVSVNFSHRPPTEIGSQKIMICVCCDCVSIRPFQISSALHGIIMKKK